MNQLPGFTAPVTRTETVSASVVDQLQTSIRPRDLVLQKDRSERPSAAGRVSQSTYVVNREAFGNAVAAFIELSHGR
jgi:hypothetical protein